jgi:hypothetical protein
MQSSDVLDAIDRFVKKLVAGKYHDPPGRVFEDGRGFWNYPLPRELDKVLTEEHLWNWYVVQAFVKAVIQWQQHYLENLERTKPSGSQLQLFAKVNLPILNASVQLIYEQDAVNLCYEFDTSVHGEFGELVPIKSRSLTNSLQIVKAERVSEIGFHYFTARRGSSGFGCGELWLLGAIPNPWMERWAAG